MKNDAERMAVPGAHPWLGQQDGELQREDLLAVDILVQAVVIRGAVLEQEGRRPALAGRVAALDEPGVRAGKRASMPMAELQELAIPASGG